jgi:hypothetical protein
MRFLTNARYKQIADELGITEHQAKYRNAEAVGLLGDSIPDLDS